MNKKIRLSNSLTVIGLRPRCSSRKYSATSRTRELMEAVAKGHRRLSVASGHGCGKSTAASWLMLHYLLTRYPCKIVVTAPTTNQLYDALMSELKSWIKQLPDSLQELLEVKAERVELKSSP